MQGIDLFEVPVGQGALAISAMPGLNGSYEDDLLAIAGWGPRVVFSMTGMPELSAAGAGQIAEHMAAVGIAHYHLPILDFGAPSPATVRLWTPASDAAQAVLDTGGRVLIHCRGGCGRSGMAALRLLVERGEEPAEALSRLRAVRPCAVETHAQYIWAVS